VKEDLVPVCCGSCRAIVELRNTGDSAEFLDEISGRKGPGDSGSWVENLGGSEGVVG